MISAWSILLGIGLIILGLAGLSGNVPGAWMAWLDFVVALGSFVVAGTIRPGTAQVNKGGPLAISAILFIMWIIGLATASASTTLIWWNFAFAVAYGLLGIIAGPPRRGGIKQPPVEEREKPRRVA